MNAHEFAEIIGDAIVGHDESEGFPKDVCLRCVESFDEVGILTHDAGLVVQFADGSEFQITVVQSGRPRDGEAGG